MKNWLPLLVICLKLASLATLIYLKWTSQQLGEKRSSFLFFYFTSFILYAISSLSDPGYLTTCPLTYLKDDERNEFKKVLKEKNNQHKTERKLSLASSTTVDQISSSGSSSGSYSDSSSEELESLTIIHHAKENTIITEKGIRKNQKGGTTVCHNQRENNIVHQEDNCRICKNKKNITKFMNTVHGTADRKRDETKFEGFSKCSLLNKLNNGNSHITRDSMESVSVLHTTIERHNNGELDTKHYPSKSKWDTNPRVKSRDRGRDSEKKMQLLSLKSLKMRQKKKKKKKKQRNGMYRHKLLPLTESCHITHDNRRYHEAEPSPMYKTIQTKRIDKSEIIFSTDIEMKLSKIFRLRKSKVYQYGQQLTYCSLCNLVQILRSKHCHTCQKCVCTFDHHCPWMNNCIAENNRIAFLLYLFFEDINIFLALKELVHVIYKMLLCENGFMVFRLASNTLHYSLFPFHNNFLSQYLSLIFMLSKCINETTYENVMRFKNIPQLKNSKRNLTDSHSNILSYQQNLLIYFSNFFLPSWIFPQVLRSYVSNLMHPTSVPTQGHNGEIFWKPSQKSPVRGSPFFFSIFKMRRISSDPWPICFAS
ncbi:palmitoyltransferase [Plasmodium gonderi]|uniref:Palmitoyltransferase n=1 Tax=Plasmodium gonderi TaxID=77519 RepID=A0A1Y1JDR2_PLAGO|nr:palmitoyltransferase [Plasmodium gonderi]GAW80390.1 palmitoyltransferase [Plasmodium gonderi]